MKYKAIVFDVSDTLIEYSPNYAKIYGDRLQSLGFDISEEKAKEVSRAINWTIGEQTRKEQLGETPISEMAYKTMLDEAALLCIVNENTCIRRYLSDLSKVSIPEQEMMIISDAINVLSVLKSKYRLAIVSNHYAWLMDYLQGSELAPFFETIIISDIVGVAKPNVRIMEIALERLNLKAGDCLYVGDHPFDVLCSKESGMDCAWIVKDESQLPSSIPYKEDYRIKALSDLLSIL